MDGTLTKADGPIRLLKDVNSMTFLIYFYFIWLTNNSWTKDCLTFKTYSFFLEHGGHRVTQVASFDAKTSAISEAQDVVRLVILSDEWDEIW